MPERIQFTTSDDVDIVGHWVSTPTTIGGAILLHAMPATKESWGAFQMILAKRGIASLAIDLRGHGESIHASGRSPLDSRAFSDEEHLSSMEDVRGAYEWIRRRGIDREQIIVTGASIGANLALRFLTEYPTLPGAVLLSPGLNYHGVRTDDIVRYVAPHQSVWMTASAGDDDESANAANTRMDQLEVDVKVYHRLKLAGHAMKMIDGDAALMGEIANWCRDTIQNFDI